MLLQPSQLSIINENLLLYKQKWNDDKNSLHFYKPLPENVQF